MHFRYFLIPALMMGAALFLPGNALAEKSDQNGRLHSNKVIVQPSEAKKNPAARANVPVNVERPKPIEKTVSLPEQAKAVKQVPPHAASKKAVAPQAVNETVKALPAQANGNGYGLSNIKQAENPQGPEKKDDVQKKNSEMEPEQLNDMAEPPVQEEKDEVEATKLEPQMEEDISNNKNAESIEPPPLPVPTEEDKAPSSEEQPLPPVDQAPIPNPTQRSPNAGGSANDRVITGIGTTSLVDKWFEWNKYFEMKLVQPFLSRYALLNTQWVNAPPSPPPQAAPFLKTVNRS
ncbi:hypothetical protein [Neobacillus niacini]|uniref:hypothetical protein n=1 Tax=Neobacillus niacini TaxID=86668 RepID=UPI0021CB1913|nr:hypothetical protein [Neobacillus niacini]MCM3763727.1 hypothetical protein [Neobacillus niacini]